MNEADFQRRLRETFQAEASEHIRALSRDAFELERTPPEAHPPLVERIFRETHTLKGAARMVGELDAEALCQTLEQRLSGLKQAGGAVAGDLIAELHRAIREIARTLGMAEMVAPSAAPPAEAVRPTEARAAPSATPPAASAAQVRVPSARLDALLMRAEEMLGAKLTGDQRMDKFRELSGRGLAWKKEWERARMDVAALRRYLDRGTDSPVAAELRSLIHYVDRTHELVTTWQRDLARLAQAAGVEQRRLGTMVQHLLDETKEVLMQPVASLLDMFPAFVREIALSQGKEIELRIEGGNVEIDRRVLEELKDALVHLVRNAVDHGIEPAAERREHGKPEQALITLAVQERSGGTVEIAVSDDGRGIDPAAVTASARRLGILGADAAELSEADAVALVFSSGFSTRTAATDLSGRGLGLAIVREKAEQIGGTISVESIVGRGTTFRILLPITLARFRGVFVTVEQQPFVIPAPYVRRVLRLRQAQVRQVKSQEVIELEHGAVTLLQLATVLGLGATRPAGRAGEGFVFAVLVEAGRSRVALRVDGAPYEQEIVMKSLGPMLRRAPNYVGATLVGAGEIVPVLNVGNLLAAAVRQGGPGRSERAAAARPTAKRKRTILVAEDSITSRSLLKSILQTAGFDVRTAVDGADALTTLKFEPVDLVISDVQMPRVDGFALTAKIRADPALSALPVILITSLASREDKARGVDAGANAYIVKSNFDQSDLLQAIGRMLP